MLQKVKDMKFVFFLNTLPSILLVLGNIIN